MLAAGVVASFGVAGASAGAAPKVELLLNHPEWGMDSILSKMPAIEEMGLEGMMQEMQNKTPEELEEMKAKMMEQMEKMQAQAKAQTQAAIAELKSTDFGKEGYKAELEALMAEMKCAESVEEQDEFGNYIPVDASKIAELKKNIAKYENDLLFKQKHRQEIKTKGADAAELLEVQEELTDILKETVESAQTLTGESTEEEKQAVEETMKEKMAGMLDHMNAAVQQAQSHMSAEDKAKQAEMLMQLTSGPMAGMMGPMAGMLEDVLAGKPLTMEYLEEGAREMMYQKEEYRQKMLLELETEETFLEEDAAKKEAALLSIKEHEQ